MNDFPPLHRVRSRNFGISPDGITIVLAAPTLESRKIKYPSLHRELYYLAVGGSVMRPVMEDPGDWESYSKPRWSPDGKQIYFNAFKLVGDSSESLSAIIEVSSGEIGNSFRRAQSHEAAWMPDSRQLVILSDGFKIFSTDGSLQQRFEQQFRRRTRLGNVSPDGRFMVYHTAAFAINSLSETHVWTLDLVSGEHVQITNDKGFQAWPYWSRDGKSIYYVSGAATVLNVYKIGLTPNSEAEKITSYSNASALYPIVNSQTGNVFFALMSTNSTIYSAPTSSPEASVPVIRGHSPTLSPDGKTIYYLDGEPGREGLWAASDRGQNAVQLVSGDVPVSYGSNSFLSPDGESIAYFLNAGSTSILYTLASTGGTAKKLHEISGDVDAVAAWSPDGSELAFIDGSSMMVISSKGGKAEKIATQKRWESWIIEWSPDGTHIAGFAFTDDDDSNVLFAVNRKTHGQQRLTPPEEDSYKEILSWHPDSDRISYMYYGSGHQNDGSRIVSLSGGDPEDLANMADPMWDYIGTWGPDSKYYFGSSPRGATNTMGLYSLDEGKNEYKKIRYHPDRGVGLPSWSKDGDRMAWSESTSVRQLWMVTEDK